MIEQSPRYTLRVDFVDRRVNQTPSQGTTTVNYQSGAGSGISSAPSHKFYGTPETGCDEIVKAVRKALSDAGIHANVILDKFEWGT